MTNRRKLRGQRAYCSDRGQRGGCGRTSSIFLEDVPPRHTVSATILGQLLVRLLAGNSVRAAFHQAKPPVALESVYHLLQRLRRGLATVRVRLCDWNPPPDCRIVPPQSPSPDYRAE